MNGAWKTMIENLGNENLSSDEIEARAGSYYRSTLAALADYSRHCNRAPGSGPNAYQDGQTNILEALGFVLGFGRESVLEDISAALAGGETDD